MAKITFSNHLAIIQTHFGHPKAWGIAMVGAPLLNPIILDLFQIDNAKPCSICHATSP
jgi:hypothetical protein